MKWWERLFLRLAAEIADIDEVNKKLRLKIKYSIGIFFFIIGLFLFSGVLVDSVLLFITAPVGGFLMLISGGVLLGTLFDHIYG